MQMPVSQELAWAVHDHVPAEAGGIVDRGLGESNEAAAPLHEIERLSCFASLTSGAVVGGAVGRLWGECCELQQIWVDPAYRRRGIGAKLVELFEARAAERGCRTFYLETFSFQAPAFYRKLGYTIACEFSGMPNSVSKILMRKDLS